jgi:AmmeMemoRadiSam system protein B
MTLRNPAVAGHFYPGEPDQLRREIDRCLPKNDVPKTKALGVVSPHAGYKYSGAVAGEVYARIEIPDRLIILSPNHTGEGLPYSIMPRGQWAMPFGKVPIDDALAERFMKHEGLLEEDEEAQRSEHALEVQLPFLQYLKKNFSFVPVTLSYINYEHCAQIGKALAQTIREAKEPVLIVASSDMNHYEEQQMTEAKDELAIDRIENLDPEGLYETVRKKRISMCGIIPVTVMLVAAIELGAKKAELIRHATSGDVTHDYGSVVGYAGMIVS